MDRLPGQAEQPDKFKPGQVFESKKGETFLRVVKVEAKNLVCQTRNGSSGRFTGETRVFSKDMIAKLYRLVK